MRKQAILPLASLILTAACSGSGSSGGGSSVSTNSSVSGKLASVSVTALNGGAGDVKILSVKKVTHVMAVAPATGNLERYIAPVAADGSFSLQLNSGKPYIIVFIAQDGILTGPDMIVGTVKVAANGLDTLPITAAAQVALGTVTIADSSQVGNATLSTSVSTLLATLGITSAEASYLGSTDDLALRLANPDVDMNGMIDMNEGKQFQMDWHIRANTQLSGVNLRMDQIENTFANEANVSLAWSGGSAYAIYPRSFDNVDYVNNGGVDTTLKNGGAFSLSGGPAPTSMSGTSGSSGGDTRNWGPDFNMSTQELGASSASTTFTYTMGTKSLKFSNVRTKLKSELNADGVLLPFLKINTAASRITGISYKWMKRSGSAWVQATASEVSLLVQDGGAFLNLYTAKSGSSSSGLTFKIPPTSASGTINIGEAGFQNSGVAVPANVALTDVCNIALSYDDRIGLRLFAGAPVPANGVTVCN